MRNPSEEIKQRYLAGPGRKFNITAFSQDFHYDSLDLDRANGAIRDAAHAYSKDGGLAVLWGNLAEKGSVVAIASGALTKVEGPGLSLQLDKPEDVALLKIDGEWHGVWQTATPDAPIPAPLQALCRHWTKLALPAHLAR